MRLALLRLYWEDVKIPTYKPHTNHKRSSVRSHTLAPTTICDLSHSPCWSPLTDSGHISSVTYVCHPLWFVCGHRKGILTSQIYMRGSRGNQEFLYPSFWETHAPLMISGNAVCVHANVSPISLEWCHLTHASSGLNKSSHFKLEFQPISQNALLLLVSRKMSPKLTSMSKGFFPFKYSLSTQKFLQKYVHFWVDQWWLSSQSPCTV